MKTAAIALLAASASAYPFVAELTGRDPAQMKRAERLDARTIRGLGARTPGDAASCPYNANHVPAAGISAKYPYCGAANGAPGFQVCANNKVPADGDTAHQYMAPGKNDIRGPCPGLNTAANHNFLARDGITTVAELLDAQQNVYGVGYDLAIVLIAFGVGLDGDPITQKLSIGCDATSRTASPGLGPELGLDGHNKFEGDTSLTRNDYFPSGGNNYQFNQTLYKEMLGYCNSTGGGNCNQAAMTKYRYQRYQESLNGNGNFYYGPKSLLLYGAASFLYELFPSLGPAGNADTTTMNYFFQKQQLPPNWYSRVTPYTVPDVAEEIRAQYMGAPVAFGANTGAPNTFVGFGETGPVFTAGNMSTAAGVACALYQVATENTPSAIGGGGAPSSAGSGASAAQLNYAKTLLNPIFSNTSSPLGQLLASGASPCPINYNSS